MVRADDLNPLLGADSIDGPELADLARCFAELGEWTGAAAGVSPAPAARGGDAYARNLLELQREIRDVAASRGVRLSWLPMYDVEGPAPEHWVRLIGGVVEGLRFLSRMPESVR